MRAALVLLLLLLLLLVLGCFGAPASRCECTYESLDSADPRAGETFVQECSRGADVEARAEESCGTNTFLGQPELRCVCDCEPDGTCAVY